jgi:hypothetical protein
MSATSSSSRKGLWASLALIGACAACCAVPLLGMLGLAAVTGAGLAAFVNSELKILLLLGAGAMLIALVLLVARKRARRAACATACATDRSCCG